MIDRGAIPGDDAAQVRATVRAKYEQVARQATGHFPYPVGREGALRLGYDSEALARVPASVVDRFVGVGCPLSARPPRPGESVLDVGCGCGLDAWLAAQAVGPAGRAVGVDLTAGMLAVGRAAARAAAGRLPDFVEGDACALPFPDASFDLVVSNGALNLVADKPAAFAEIARVLRPGGEMAVADLLLVEDLPREVREDPAAWAG